MKIAILTNYPWADNVKWKRDVVELLQNDGHEVDIHYGRAGLKSHAATFLKRRRYKQKSTQGEASDSASSNLLHFLSKGVRVRLHRDFNSPRTIRSISESGYDYHVTALDQILSTEFLRLNSNILNVHYGKLPEIKGIDSISWTVLETGSLSITMHHIAPKVDTGDIIHIEHIDIDSDMSIATCRKKIHRVLPMMYLRFFRGEFSQRTSNHEGNLYSYMHPDVYRLLNR